MIRAMMPKIRSIIGLLLVLPLPLFAADSAPAGPAILAPFAPLPVRRAGDTCSSIVRLPDGSLLTTEGNATVLSRDGGKTWGERRPIIVEDPANPGRQPATGVPRSQIMLVRTRDGVLVAVWSDPRVDDWDPVTGALGPKADGDVWSIRSTDGGRTWTDRCRLFDGICGHPPINLLELRDGKLVVPVQYYVSHPLRCVIRTYVSSDAGITWRGGNVIDIGGNGHHDGGFEPSLVELRDGRVWMLIRTNLDRFWEAVSEDGGLYWRTIRPSAIEASSSPPYLTRLASGRLILFWNRLYPEGKSEYMRRSSTFSEVEGSWHREELSVALSEDDGATWSAPRVVAREPNKWLSYSYAFEPEPGRLWLFSAQGRFAAQVSEADLVAAVRSAR